MGGVTVRSQGGFERDVNLPGSAYLLALAAGGFDVGYVLTGRPMAMTEEEAALLRNYRAADPERRKEVRPRRSTAAEERTSGPSSEGRRRAA